jgi:DNA-binding NarL/FixJ family response regulator
MKTTETIQADIIIADIQLLVIEGLKALLQGKYTTECCVSSKSELLEALHHNVPRLLIVDYSLLDFNGFDDIKTLKKEFPALGIIVLSNNISRNELVEFNNAGVKNILHKTLELDELFACIEAALNGKKYYSSLILDMMLELSEKRGTMDETVQLTASEIEIVRLIAAGLTTKEIALKRFISFHTVMTHRKNILRKLGVSNASELIMVAVKNGIIDTIEYHI